MFHKDKKILIPTTATETRVTKTLIFQMNNPVAMWDIKNPIKLRQSG